MYMELRFVEREKWDEAKDEGLGVTERVLQYREWAGLRYWHDIPLVKAERKSGDGKWTVKKGSTDA